LVEVTTGSKYRLRTIILQADEPLASIRTRKMAELDQSLESCHVDYTAMFKRPFALPLRETSSRVRIGASASLRLAQI
jgi:hypothetical protein